MAVLNLPSYLATLRAELAEEVRVIMTTAAASIMPPSTVALICDGVFLDEQPTLEKRPGHIELARWCELFVVLPATANVIGQVANGLGPNLLTTTILASPKPVVLYPNVNDVMWNKSAVQRNVETLREDGHIVIEPEVATAYEVDSGETRESLVIPEPTQMVEQLREIHRQL
ncbi:MAG: Mersacidin decarboxylase [Actinomycetota bacterium]|nr:Mersacidin decarboxylase [Actinomycetota bacterium]